MGQKHRPLHLFVFASFVLNEVGLVWRRDREGGFSFEWGQENDPMMVWVKIRAKGCYWADVLETYPFFPLNYLSLWSQSPFKRQAPRLLSLSLMRHHHKDSAPLVRKSGEGQVVLITPRRPARSFYHRFVDKLQWKLEVERLRWRTKAREEGLWCEIKHVCFAFFSLWQTKFVSCVIDNCLGQLFCALQYTEAPFRCYSSSIISYANIPLLALILLNISMASIGHQSPVSCHKCWLLRRIALIKHNCS